MAEEAVQEETQELSVEAQATQLGWHPPEDFRGDPENALGAQEFIDKIGESDAIMRSNFKKMQNTVARNEADMAQMKVDTSNYITMSVNAKVQDIEKSMRQAVIDGDTKAYDAADKEKKEIEKTPVSTGPSAAVQAFMQNNDWYGTDQKKTDYANFLDSTNQGTSEAEHYTNITKKVNDHFATPAAKPPALEGGGRSKTTPKGSQTFAGMDAESQAACDRMVKAGVGVTKEGFVKNYYKGKENG